MYIHIYISINNKNTRNHSCLDNIFINFIQCNFNCTILDPRLSDHLGILLSLHVPEPRPAYRRINHRPISDTGLYNLNNYLQKIDWSFVNNLDIHNKFEQFINYITSAVEKAFPEKSKLVNDTRTFKINWFNINLQHMRDTLHFLEDIGKRAPSEDMKRLIKTHRLYYRSQLCKARKDANDKFISNSSNSQKAMWQIINSNKHQPEIISEISPNELNVHFANIAKNIIDDLPATNYTHNDFLGMKTNNAENQFSFREVTYIEVNDIINNLKKTKSKNAYYLDMKILNAIRYIILIPLTNLINICIGTNTYLCTKRQHK